MLLNGKMEKREDEERGGSDGRNIRLFEKKRDVMDEVSTAKVINAKNDIRCLRKIGEGRGDADKEADAILIVGKDRILGADERGAGDRDKA